MKKLIPFVLLLGLVAAGLWWKFGSHSGRARDGTLRLYGNVDIREVNLGFRVGGRLTQVLRDEGDQVQPEDELARLDAAPFTYELEEAKGRLAAAKARLRWLEAGSRPQEIAQARATVKEREVSAANAETIFKRQEALFKNQAVSVQERDDAEARYREMTARLKSAQEQLNLIEAGFREEEIAQARAEVARAEAASGSAKLRLDDTILRAPSRGLVLTRAQEPGAILQAGSTVLTLSLERPVWVRAYVNEPDLGRVPPGTKVRLYTDSRRERPYAGQVGFVSPRAEFTPKNVETPELRTTLVYRLRINVEDPDDQLRQGMPVTIVVGSP